MIFTASSRRPLQSTQSRSRGLASLTDLSCHSTPVSYNLCTKESCIGHGRPLMKSGTFPAPVFHPQTGLSATPSASHFSRKWSHLNVMSYANFLFRNVTSYANFVALNVTSYANFCPARFSQSRYTKPLTSHFPDPLKLMYLNQYTQTRRQEPPVVCSVFLLL